jgi:hypothetical protein
VDVKKVNAYYLTEFFKVKGPAADAMDAPQP